VTLQKGLEGRGGIARGEDAGDLAPAIDVGTHTAATGARAAEHGRAQPLQIGINPYAEYHVVASNRAAVVDHDAVQAAVAASAGDAMPQQQLDAVGAMQIGEPGPQLAAEHALQRRRRRLDYRRLDARRARGRGGLLSDEAGPDHQQSCAGDERRPQPRGILARAQRGHVLKTVEHSRPSGAGPGGDQQALIGDARAVSEVNGHLTLVQADRSHSQPQRHRLLLIPSG